MSQKKAQIHMTETIAVLFIFFILIVFGLIFYYQYQKVNVKEQAEEQLALRAMDTTLKVLFLPELTCTKGKAEAEDNCLDALKLKYAGELFKENTLDYYFNLFSYAKISVVELYPSNEEIVLYDHPKPDWQSLEPTYFVISIKDDLMGYNKAQAFYRFAYLKVEVYS